MKKVLALYITSWSILISVILWLLCLIILLNARLAHGQHAFLWDNGTWIDLGTLGGETSMAYGINDLGQVVGFSETASGENHAFLWENGVMTDLGSLDWISGSEAYDINNQGQIVGNSGHAFLWENGVMTDLGNLPISGIPWTASFATAINNSGQIVGYDRYSNHAILWKNMEITDLGTFGGDEVYPRDINDSEQIVGSIQGADAEYGRNWAGFLWDNGEITDLGGLSSGGTEARSINNSGQIVGGSYKEGQSHAFLWENGVMTELHLDSFSGSSAWDINDLSQVAIHASYHQLAKRGWAYWSHAFLWNNGDWMDLGTLGGENATPTAINNQGQIVGHSERRWYVDVNNPTPGDGKSWWQAFNTIQEAVDIAHYDDEIWVMKGTFLLSSTINIRKRLWVYGGFGGWENNVQERDIANNVTIIDGQDKVGCLNIAASSAWIDGFVFTRGYADLGGAIYVDNSGNLTIWNCIFSENTAESGGAIYNAGQLIDWGEFCDPCPGDSSVENCVFFGNTAQYGGAVYSDTYNPTFQSCTFFRNSADYGGAIYSKDSGTVLLSSILWADTDTTGQEIYESGSSSTLVEYCNIQGGYPGEGNIDADPLFIDEENGDYHLTANSPCVDAGEDYKYCDLEGDPRNIGSAPDIGADEYSGTTLIGTYDIFSRGGGSSIDPNNLEIAFYYVEDYPNQEIQYTLFSARAMDLKIGDVFNIGSSPNFSGFVDYITDGNSGHLWNGVTSPWGGWAGTGWREPHVFWDDKYIANDLKDIYEVSSAEIKILDIEVKDTGDPQSPTYYSYRLELSLYGHQIGQLPPPFPPWYVDGEAVASGDGTSWSQAFRTIEEAIEAADSGDEIWIKQGTYSIITTINVNKGVAIYAGFNGTETQKSERNWRTNVTTVDGQDMVRCFRISADATIDGFTITNGYTSGGGGGIYIVGSTVAVNNCYFLGNHAATNGGGAIHNWDANITITNSVFFENEGGGNGGGAIYTWECPSVTITNCTFSKNDGSISGGGAGGAIYNYRSPATLTNSIFWEDTAASGQEIYNEGATLILSHCDIDGDLGGIVNEGSGTIVSSGGNLAVPPLFINPENRNLRLQPGSPCINAGGNAAADSLTNDLNGKPRIFNGIVDMGAYEYHPTWYVDTDMPVSGDGTSWSEAFKTIQEAIDAADTGCEIWVRKGTYLLSSAINVNKSVAIYGGFDGTEIELSQRNSQLNVTTVDGQDKVNCFTVTADVTIDGFSITNGLGVYDDNEPAGLRGGAIYHSSYSLTIANSKFIDNIQADFGGAIYSESDASLLIIECDFNGNRAYHEGGAIKNNNGTLNVVNSSFENNKISSEGQGGAISSGGFLTVADCTFTGNGGEYTGGAISASSCTITDSTFTENVATGGGAIQVSGPDVNISNCTFLDNSAGRIGGGAIFISETTASISYCRFIKNYAGGGLGGGGGAILVYSGQPVITNCIFSGNDCETTGGAINNGVQGEVQQIESVIRNCTFHGNRASLGAAIFNEEFAASTIDNSILWGDPVLNGIQIVGGTLTVSFSDINQDGYDGTDGNIRQNPLFIAPGYWDDNGTPSNMWDDFWVDGGDYNLQAGSLCINSGDNTAYDLPPFDLDGKPRIIDGVVDMGAFEYSDLDSDSDGYTDNKDNCPNTYNPGQADKDRDSAGDACDDCDNDPNKVEPGICGCGIADNDSDLDGTPDCNDNCPNDPDKIEPGACGCGAVDSDTDSDGAPDCNDSCPNDPNKTKPGICGCGMPDTDTDGDGTFDCNDSCDNLIDSDSDGTNDCDDQCPTDSGKAEPGVCGCGVPDIDTDGDGSLDCNDNCPVDPNKTGPGICGCGMPDIDTDGDGTVDCAETDDDNDGLADEEEQGSNGDDPDYDGNDDGIADCLQANVASFHTYDGKKYVTIESPAGTSIKNCRAADNPSVANSPTNLEFSFGFFKFAITGINSGKATTVILHLPAGSNFDTYYKFGPTPGNSVEHWYEFLNDGQTGAEINGNVIKLHFLDSKRGDDDLTVDGVIIDIGGPAVSLDPGAGDDSGTSSGGGGGGCFIGAAVNSLWWKEHVDEQERQGQ